MNNTPKAHIKSLIKVLDLMCDGKLMPGPLIPDVKEMRDILNYTIWDMNIVPSDSSGLDYRVNYVLYQRPPDFNEWTPSTEIANYYRLVQIADDIYEVEGSVSNELEMEIVKAAAEVEKIVDTCLEHRLVRWAITFCVFKDSEVEQVIAMLCSAPVTPQAKLFPNSKDLTFDTWAMPQFLANNLSRIIKDINPEKQQKQLETIDSRKRETVTRYKVNGRKSSSEFIYDPAAVASRNVEKFVEKLLALKNPKVLQTFFALWKWAGKYDTNVFNDVPISDIMALVLKPGELCKFNKEQRKEFSEILMDLASISITQTMIGERSNPKTGKGKVELKERSGIKLLDIEATYSVKKEFQILPKEELDEHLHFDREVITRFSGALMPNSPDIFKERGSVYSNSLLRLDANKDGKAILMGFHIQTRFNQSPDKEYMEVDRAFLINLCDYQKTNDTKPSQATKQIINNLDKLVKTGLIAKHSGLGHKQTDRVKIYRPQQTRAIASPIQ